MTTKIQDKELKKKFLTELGHTQQMKNIWSYLKVFVLPEFYEQGRQEALDEDLEESETRADIAKENYSAGYIDAKKGRKKAPHDTRDGWCCACEYDLAVMGEKIKEAEKRGEKKILAKWKKSMDKHWFTNDMQSDFQKSSK